MRRRLPLLVALLSFGPLLSTSAPTQNEGLEYDVKAAFLLNFSRYVTWPPDRLKPPFRICVYGSNPFGRRLTDAVRGERWQEQSIDVRVLETLAEGRACHILYVPAAAGDVLGDHWPVDARATLTVGEHENFLTEGGMIRFFLEDNRVRFSINQMTAEAAGLQISSRLLRLARTVVPQHTGRH
jgi:hypothetical protein